MDACRTRGSTLATADRRASSASGCSVRLAVAGKIRIPRAEADGLSPEAMSRINSCGLGPPIALTSVAFHPPPLHGRSPDPLGSTIQRGRCPSTVRASPGACAIRSTRADQRCASTNMDGSNEAIGPSTRSSTDWRRTRNGYETDDRCSASRLVRSAVYRRWLGRAPSQCAPLPVRTTKMVLSTILMSWVNDQLST